MYFKEQEVETLYFLSTTYKETDVPKMYVDHEPLCSMRYIHFRHECFLSGVREIYNVATSGNLKYIS